MNSFDIGDLVTVAVLATVVTAAIVSLIAVEIGDRRDARWSKKYQELHTENYALDEKNYFIEAENRRLSSHFDYRVEKEVQKQIREWTPDEMTAEEEFARADYMAKHRRTLDAGRSHPPRDDGGEPARIHKLTLKR